MIITVAGYKGGTGKTTTAVHLACCLQSHAPALLIDGDPNRSASGWARRGAFPFRVVDERQAARYAREYEHIVIDTKARQRFLREAQVLVAHLIQPVQIRSGQCDFRAAEAVGEL